MNIGCRRTTIQPRRTGVTTRIEPHSGTSQANLGEGTITTIVANSRSQLSVAQIRCDEVPLGNTALVDLIEHGSSNQQRCTSSAERTPISRIENAVSSIRGDNLPNARDARYVKFSWNSASDVPSIGELDYVPRTQAFRMFAEGRFTGQRLIAFPAQKRREALHALGCCAYCGRANDQHGFALPLTSEHVIAEALGCGLELPQASCFDCQRVTSEFERSVTEEMFDPVRRSLNLVGKQGVLQKKNFALDVGAETSEFVMISDIHHPTLLTLPGLYPPSACSYRPMNTNGIFNILTYNINCRRQDLDKYEITRFSTQIIDTARFCQMIAKIAHVACMGVHGRGAFKPLVADFIRTSLPPKTPSSAHFNFVGRLWQEKSEESSNLHEVEIGEISWKRATFISARVRLFASHGMPSYHVIVGE